MMRSIDMKMIKQATALVLSIIITFIFCLFSINNRSFKSKKSLQKPTKIKYIKISNTLLKTNVSSIFQIYLERFYNFSAKTYFFFQSFDHLYKFLIDHLKLFKKYIPSKIL